MAQHDYVIANGTGSAVRSDLNNALAAIVSQNSGASEPSPTFAFQLWADTTTNTLKLRNSANSAWIELRQLDGDFTKVSVDNGTAGAPSIYFNASGTDTGIYSSGTDALDFSTAGTQRLGISSAGDLTVYSGNVTLNAQGDLRFADSDSSNWVAFQSPATVSSNVTWTLPSADGTNGQALTTNGSGTLSWTSPAATTDKITEGNTEAEVVDTGSDGHFKVTTEGTERMRINSSGNVGIGTTSPSTVLHCEAAQAEVNIKSTSGTNSAGLRFVPGGQTNAWYIYANGSRNLVFDDHASERMRIDASGRLLVGTSTDLGGGISNRKLQVASDNGGFAVLSRDDSSIVSGDAIGAIEFIGRHGGNTGRAADIFVYADADHGTNDYPGRLVFSTTADGASSPTERLTIKNDGKVGIGYNQPSARFEVRSNATSELVAAFYQASTSYAQAAVYIDVNRATTDSSYNFLRCIQQSATDKLFIRDSGTVQNATGTYNTISDLKLKENVVDASSQWEDIKNIRIRNYNFKPETNHQTHKQIGVIAQELELVCPGLVEEAPDLDAEGNDLGTTTKGVKSSILYMKAVKALQEAMERIEALEAEVAALKGA